MVAIEEVREVMGEAVRCRRRCLVAVLLSGLLTAQVTLAVVLPSEPVSSAVIFALILGTVFILAVIRFCRMNAALAGLEFSAWMFHLPVSVEPRPARHLGEHRPLPHWLFPRGDFPAPHRLASAVAEVVERDPRLIAKRAECIAARGELTVYDGVNLIFAARALERAR